MFVTNYLVKESDFRRAVVDHRGWCPHCCAFTACEVNPWTARHECPRCMRDLVAGAQAARIFGWIVLGNVEADKGVSHAQ